MNIVFIKIKKTCESSYFPCLTDAIDDAAQTVISVDEVVNEKSWWTMFRETLEPLANSRNAAMERRLEHLPRINYED